MSQDVERLTVKEYADRYRVTENAVRRAIRFGLFPHRVDRPTGKRGWIQILVPIERKQSQSA